MISNKAQAILAETEYPLAPERVALPLFLEEFEV